MTSPFERFAALHVPGDPLILFNVWDAGSARAVAGAGACAIATGSASVAGSLGHEDGETLPLELALSNAERVVAATDLPTTIDFEAGYGATPDEVARSVAALVATGAVGCNIEDQRIGDGTIRSVAEQVARLRAVRAGAGDAMFVNARTDLFLQTPARDHDAALADAAIERARAYADAGANGFFVPALVRPDLLERVCAVSPLPVNYLAMPDGPDARTVAALGVARVSHGPFPYREAMRALAERARMAIEATGGAG